MPPTPPKDDGQPGPTHPEVTKLIDHLATNVSKLPYVLKAQLGKKKRLGLPKLRKNHTSLTSLAFGVAKANPSLVTGNTDVAELPRAWEYLTSLRLLHHSLQGHADQVADSIRQLEADLWMMAMRIYGVAKHTTAHPGQDQITEFVRIMKENLAHGPREQKHQMVDLKEPIPHSKAGMEKLLLEKAKAELARGGKPPGEGE